MFGSGAATGACTLCAPIEFALGMCTFLFQRARSDLAACLMCFRVGCLAVLLLPKRQRHVYTPIVHV